MTKRYYYTDPLAAAWMDRNFDIRLESEHGDTILVIGGELYWGQGGGFSGSAYIRPTSLHLLEPRLGDLVRWRVIDPRGGFFADAGAFGIYEGAGHVERVVERDGKPFFWPESE
jgi:hypothetical protein